MPITKQAKRELVADLTSRITASKEQVLVGYQGLTVKELEELRGKLRAAHVSFGVVKNTLLKRILADAKIAGLDPTKTKKPLAIAIGADEVTPAKVLVEFAKTHKKLEIVSGAIDGAPVDTAQLTALAALPGREELLGIVVRTIAAPVSGFVRVLGALPRSLVQVLAAIGKSKS